MVLTLFPRQNKRRAVDRNLLPRQKRLAAAISADQNSPEIK
jgi:hypothetical protein